MAAALLLGVLLALALAAVVEMFRRYDRAMHEQLLHERARGAERAVRIIELEQLTDQMRAAAAGVTPPDPAQVALRAQAKVEVGGPAPVAGAELPRELQQELAAIEDPEARGELEELVRFRLAAGEAPDAILAELFG